MLDGGCHDAIGVCRADMVTTKWIVNVVFGRRDVHEYSNPKAYVVKREDDSSFSRSNGRD